MCVLCVCVCVCAYNVHTYIHDCHVHPVYIISPVHTAHPRLLLVTSCCIGEENKATKRGFDEGEGDL